MNTKRPIKKSDIQHQTVHVPSKTGPLNVFQRSQLPPVNYIFLSGDSDVLNLDADERRYWVVSP